MLARSDSSSPAVRRSYNTLASEDRALIKRVASGDEEALGSMVDRWGDHFYQFTDALKVYGREADDMIEEVLRRLAFEASRFVVRPEKFGEWIQRTLRECAGAVVARRTVADVSDSLVLGRGRAAKSPEGRSPVAVIFQSLLGDGRVADALGYLNGQTPFRFTAVYRFDGLFLANVYLYDRQVGFGNDESVARVSDTYCLWIHETLSVVQMSDSMTDPRARQHPKREKVRSYCGGPIHDENGKLFGTICHFDFEPHAGTVETLPILAEVGPLLALQIQSTLKASIN